MGWETQTWGSPVGNKVEKTSSTRPGESWRASAAGWKPEPQRRDPSQQLQGLWGAEQEDGQEAAQASALGRQTQERSGETGAGAAFFQQEGLGGGGGGGSWGVKDSLGAKDRAPGNVSRAISAMSLHAGVLPTRRLRTMGVKVPTRRSREGLDSKARAPLSHHLPSWTIVDTCVSRL